MISVNGLEIHFEKFPNGETRIDKESFKGLLHYQKENHVHFKYEGDSDLIKLMMIKRYLDSNHVYSSLVVYYMPYSRMDRSEENSPFTLKYIADFINSLGFKSVRIIEPHSDVTPALINNSRADYINFELIDEVKREVSFNEEKDYIVFPDAGASKRYSKMKAKNVLTCNKVRDFQTGEIKSLELMGDTSKAYGGTAILIDDLSSYGGTFVHTANRLREEGFVNIYLLVAHAENSIFKGKLFENVDKVFTTDSILTEQYNWENAKFKQQLKIYPIQGVLVE